MVLDGYTKDKNHMPISNAIIEIKGNDFATIYKTNSDSNGYYQFDIPEGDYPFLTAVKDYAVKYLEYWCQNIRLQQNMHLDIFFDTLEVYGLHTFTVKGSGNSRMVYFRPMSLHRYLLGESNIAPDEITIEISIDGIICPMLVINRVLEYADGKNLTAYLVQIKAKPDEAWQRIDVKITDSSGNQGMATIFN